MKNEYKKKIRKYRLSGKGYMNIANLLNLSVDEVKQYCKENGLGGPAEYVKYNHMTWGMMNQRCPVCGNKLIQPKIGRKKIFCSNKCRIKHCREKERFDIVDLYMPEIGDNPEINLLDDYVHI